MGWLFPFGDALKDVDTRALDLVAFEYRSDAGAGL
jgi:hypothetical protein